MEKGEVRKFTKDQKPEERSQAASEIKAVRAEYFEQKRSRTERIEGLAESLENRTANKERLFLEISQIENDIKVSEQKSFGRIFDFFKIRSLQKDLGIKQEDLTKAEEEYTKINSEIAELNQIDLDKSLLENARAKLDKFYGEQSEAYQEFKEGERVRDVREISQEKDVMFVHGITPEGVPDDNSLLDKNVSWKDKLKILAAFEPTVSTSTIKAGDSPDRMWSPMGFVLKGGRVESAFAGDAGTIAKGIKDRDVRSGRGSLAEMKPDEAAERVGDTIRNRPNTGLQRYNELAVSNPNIAGFYLNLDVKNQTWELDNGRRAETPSPKEILQEISKLGMPFYFVEQGKFYTAKQDEQGNYVKDKLLDTENILNNDFQVDNEMKMQLQQEIFEDSPFKISSPETQFVDSSADGKRTFLSILSESQSVEELVGEEKEYQESSKRILGRKIPAGSRVKVISRGAQVGYTSEYFVHDGKIYEKSVNIRTEEATVRESGDSFLASGDIRIGRNLDKISESKIGNPEDYLKGMEQKLHKIQKEIEDKAGDKWSEKFYREWKNKLLFHLYGFAEEAGKHGMQEVRKSSHEIASSYMSQEQYQEVLKRRIDEQGRFKITEADLP